MIQSIMLVALGFLIATLCALLLAPSFWRRAERLTTQRLERSMPMSIADTEADRDQLRASYAIIIRRLEAALSQEKLRSARQLVKISRLEMQIAQLNETAAQLRGQLDAEHNAASVLRRTIATRVPELRDAAQGARQLVHVRDHEIRSIVNRLRQREEALAVAQRTTDMQQAEIARLRQAMEMSGAQNAGRFKLRPTQWSIHDYRAEYDRLNVELSKLRERLSVAYDREANQVKQLRTELQQLADQIVTASALLPEREAPRAITAGPSSEEEDAASGNDIAAARSIDAILSDDSGTTTQMPALRAATPAENFSERRGRSGGLLSSALSPKRLARGAAATIAGLTGGRTDISAPEAGPSVKDRPSPEGHERPVKRLSAAELLGGAAAARRESPLGSAATGPDPQPARSSDSQHEALNVTGAPDEPASKKEATPVTGDATDQEATDASSSAPAAPSETATADSLYDVLRTSRPSSTSSPDAPETQAKATGDEKAASDTPHVEKVDGGEGPALTSPESVDAATPDEAADTVAPDSTEDSVALEAENGAHASANGHDRDDVEEENEPAASLLDRLKQVPETPSR